MGLSTYKRPQTAMAKTLSRISVNSQERKSANQGKPRTNLSKISRYLHIIIFSYLEPIEILRLSAVSRSLMSSSHENGVWEERFINKKRLNDY